MSFVVINVHVDDNDDGNYNNKIRDSSMEIWENYHTL